MSNIHSRNGKNTNVCKYAYEETIYGYDPQYNDNKQCHVHEFIGSTLLAECKNLHNHRFAAISQEAIPLGNNCNSKNHVHKVKFRTDFCDDHYHEFTGTTSGAIAVGDGRHVHFLKSVTSENDHHKHKFRAATLIENPTEDKCKKK